MQNPKNLEFYNFAYMHILGKIWYNLLAFASKSQIHNAYEQHEPHLKSINK